MSDNWYLKLFKKSICKQNKLKAILRYLDISKDARCLDIGGDNGVISYYLRQQGGSWVSADLEDEAVVSIRGLVGGDVYRIDGRRTPFVENSFDAVVIIDFLEHIPTDQEFINELFRIIKDKGVLIINVPYLKRFSLLRWLRNLWGLGAASHGHLREGYTVGQLRSLLGDRFTIIKSRTYSQFFTELIDTLIGFFYTRSRGKTTKKGVLVTQEDLSQKAKAFKFYAAIYPLVWLVSRLDFLLFFTSGYSLILKARKNPL